MTPSGDHVSDRSRSGRRDHRRPLCPDRGRLQSAIRRRPHLQSGLWRIPDGGGVRGLLDVHARADRPDPGHAGIGAGDLRGQLAGLPRADAAAGAPRPHPRRPRRRHHPGHLRALVRAQGRGAARLHARQPLLQLSQRAGADPGLHLRGQPGARLRRCLRVRARHLAVPHPHPLRRRDARARHRADRRPPGRRRRQRHVGARVRLRRRAGGGGWQPGEHVPHLQSRQRGRVHHEGAGGGDDGRGRQHGRQPGRRHIAGCGGIALLLPDRFRPHAGGRLFPVPDRAADPAARPVRDPVMRAALAVAALVVLVAALAAVPWLVSDYGLGFMINLMCYLVLTVAWALFSGTTRYVSLATAAFFGVGAYTVAMLVKVMPIYATFGIALVLGTLMALLVGLVTLRISGMFFVIFGFGLSELMRELLVWWEINRTHTMGRYVFVPFDTTLIYEHLLGLAVLVFLVGWLLRRSRLGVALLVIGDDETMARQAGINVPLAKVMIFVVSSVFMTVVGAVMAPRFGYLSPEFAFNPLISFTVVIMALLGGMQRLWGPVLGVIPLAVLSELLQVRFPFWYSVFLGLVFMVIVYFLPRGVTGLVEDAWEALRRPIALPRGVTGPIIDAWTFLSQPISLPRGIAGAIEDGWARVTRRQPSGGR